MLKSSQRTQLRRSVLESGNRPVSSIFVRMLAKSGGKAGVGGCIRTTIPYIRTEIPIVIVFRALGFVADKDILEHIVYDFNDTAMMEMLRPSLEEAFVIQNQQVPFSTLTLTKLAKTVSLFVCVLICSAPPNRVALFLSRRHARWGNRKNHPPCPVQLGVESYVRGPTND